MLSIRPAWRLGACLALAVTAMAQASPVGSQGPPSEPRAASLIVPGGVKALAAVIGINPSLPRSRVMLTAIRVLYGLPAGVDPTADAIRERTREYLAALVDVTRVRASVPAGRVSFVEGGQQAIRRLAEDLAHALGAEVEETAGGVRLRPGESDRAVRRRQSLGNAGLAVGELEKQLNERHTVTLDMPGDAVPLPLPASSWAGVPDVPSEFAGSLFATVLGDRRAALSYYGLCSMDGPTRAFVAAHPDLLTRLLEPRMASVLAMYGRSLHVREGRVEVPGGATAVPLWQALVGESVSEPLKFLSRVLEKDTGRVALFYDAVDHLAPPAQAFALGSAIADPSQRRDRFEALYDAAEPALAGWNPTERPFERVIYDVAHLLTVIRVTSDARLVEPAASRLWRAVWSRDSLPSEPAADLREAEDDGAVDAAWLVSRVGVTSSAIRRDRAETWLFAQRVFHGAAAADMPDVLVALRGFPRFRSLLLSLERMGITRGGTYAAAVRQADIVSRISDRPKAAVSMAQFQGALSLVERARLSRVLDVPAAEGLILSLCRLPLSDDEYLGSLASWLRLEFFTAVGPPVVPVELRRPGRAADEHALSAIAGSTAQRPGGAHPLPTIEWEGLSYRVDPAGAELRRLMAVRTRQGGPSLNAALSLARTADRIAAIASPADAAAGLSELQSLSTALETDPPDAGPDRNTDPLSPGAMLTRAREALNKLLATPDAKTLGRIARPLRRAADKYLARVLASLAYAPHLGDVQSAALLGGDPSIRHDFGLSDPGPGQARLNAWRLAQEARDEASGWHLEGSLLAFDVALGSFALRRVATDRLPEPSAVTDSERLAFTEVVVLMNPFDQIDAARDRLMEALRRGRARLDSLTSSPDSVGVITASADLDEWRGMALTWALANEPEAVPGLFSLGDLVRMGVTGAAAEGWDAFGTSALSLDGCLCLRYAARQPWTTLSGRKGMRLVSALVPDVTLGLVDALARLGLPAILTRGALATATQDFLDELRPDYEDDWPTLVGRARVAMNDRVEDYVAALTIWGPLMPVAPEPLHVAFR